MAVITIDIGSITGESSVAASGERAHIEAFAMSDFINSNGGGASAEVGEIQLHRYRDRASPHLAHACAAGTSLGDVTVTLHINGSDGLEEFYKVKLTETYVSRIEQETSETSGNSLKRHYGYSGASVSRDYWGRTVANDERATARERARPAIFYAEQPGTYTDDEVERIWLSGEVVTWTFVEGNITTSWDIARGRVPEGAA